MSASVFALYMVDSLWLVASGGRRSQLTAVSKAALKGKPQESVVIEDFAFFDCLPKLPFSYQIDSLLVVVAAVAEEGGSCRVLSMWLCVAGSARAACVP